jgi:hypothetical protein
LTQQTTAQNKTRTPDLEFGFTMRGMPTLETTSASTPPGPFALLPRGGLGKGRNMEGSWCLSPSTAGPWRPKRFIRDLCNFHRPEWHLGFGSQVEWLLNKCDVLNWNWTQKYVPQFEVMWWINNLQNKKQRIITHNCSQFSPFTHSSDVGSILSRFAIKVNEPGFVVPSISPILLVFLHAGDSWSSTEPPLKRSILKRDLFLDPRP